MKRNPLEINGGRRSISLAGRMVAALFLLLLGTAAGRATSQQVVFPLTGFTVEDGLSQSGSSANLLPPAFAYSYEITGTVHGTGDLASIIPAGTSLATALNTLDPTASPPFSDNLQGTVLNPGGTLPFSILTNKVAAGTLAGGLITASATFNLGVDATGRAIFSITNVSFIVFGSHNTSDTIVFDSGSVTTTAVLTPAVITGTASTVTGTSAILNATVNPNGDNTSVVFEYGSTVSYTNSTSAQIIPTGISTTAVSGTIAGLNPGATYHFAVIATNSTGTTTGSDQTLVTTAAVGAPVATTGTAGSITTTTATLNGSVNPSGNDTSVTFQYGLTTAYGATTTAQDIGSGSTSVAVTGTIGSLISGTTYHFQVTGSNSQGVSAGGDQTFTTSPTVGAPTATTGSASDITTTTATLNGLVNPNGNDTSVTFQYGPTASYGTTTTAEDIGSGSSAVAVTGTIGGLVSGSTYHFQVTGSNAQGVTNGGDQTFTTPAISFAAFAGKYVASFSGGTNDTSGMVTVTVSGNGVFTGSGKLGGRKFSFVGKFGGGGFASVTVLGSTLDLQLGTTDGTNSLTGSVTSPVPFTFTAGAVLVTKTFTPAIYTVRLTPPSDSSLPQGNGYGTMTVGKTGAVHLTGKLGDGATFTASGGLLADGTWPLYALVYGNKGSVVGTITFESTVNGDLDGAVNWFKPATSGTYYPATFSAQVNLYGSLYTPSKPVLNFTDNAGVVELGLGNLAAMLDINVILNADNKITFPTTPAPDKFKMTITTATGLIKGSFKDPTTNELRKFNGAVFQGSLNFGVGEFEGSTEAGALEFVP